MEWGDDETAGKRLERLASKYPEDNGAVAEAAQECFDLLLKNENCNLTPFAFFVIKMVIKPSGDLQYLHTKSLNYLMQIHIVFINYVSQTGNLKLCKALAIKGFEIFNVLNPKVDPEVKFIGEMFHSFIEKGNF